MVLLDGGALAVGERDQRQIAFFIAVTTWGVLRDHLLARRTGILVFGPEPRASVADGAAYLSVAILVQAVLRTICREAPK